MLSESERQRVCQELDVCLANEYLLYTKTRKYHWNVVGWNFEELHELFEEQYDILADIVEEMAERIRQLQFAAPGTMREFLDLSVLQEAPNINPSAQAMVSSLLDDHQIIIEHLRQSILVADQNNDIGTSNFLTDKMEQHDKIAWMLRSHLE